MKSKKQGIVHLDSLFYDKDAFLKVLLADFA